MSNEQIRKVSVDATKSYFIDGDEKALLKLLEICSNILSKKIRNYGLDDATLEDYTQELTAELLKAKNRFDIDVNDNFITFVLPRIRAMAVRALNDKLYPMIHHENKRVLRCINHIKYGNEDRLAEMIANDVGTVETTIKNARLAKDITKISIEGCEESDEPLYLPAKARDFGDDMDAQTALNYILKAIDDLPPRNKRITEEVYFKGNTLKTVAEQEGLSIERIRQLREQSVDMIRDTLEATNIIEDINVEIFAL